MEIKPIKTEKITIKLSKDLKIFLTQKSSPEGDELEVLGILVDQYERAFSY
jgi:HTH-type transcriptional regulator/antitoxin HigA